MRRLTRSEIRHAHLDMPIGNPFGGPAYGEKRDGVGDIIGGVVDTVGDVVGSVGDAVGGVVESVVNNPIITSVAAAVFPPIAPFVAGMNVVRGLESGNILQAASGMLGVSGGAGSWFDVPVSDATALDAWYDLPVEAQQAYLDAGISPTEVGSALARDSVYSSAFDSLPVDAQQAYLDAGYSPSVVGSQIMSAEKQAIDAFYSLPEDAQQAYLSAGYNPAEVGANVLTDAAIASGSGTQQLGLMKNLKSILSGSGSNVGAAGMLGTGANLLAGYLQGNAAKDATTAQAAATVDAARIAADAARFKPVGVTTRFGSSQFGYDQQGRLNAARYNLSPELQAQQDKMMTLSGGMLDQYALGQEAALPMGTAGARAMTLGNQYLAADPAAQAQLFMNQQNALLAPGNAAELAKINNRLAQQGRLGLATGGEAGMMATNPELAAYQNKLEMQQRQLAAQSTQAGQDYARFGAGMVGTGGDLLKGMYGAQTAAYAPYQTALGGAQTLEGLGQNALTQGMQLGSTTTAANAAAGGLLQSGMNQANALTAQANAYSPWAGMLAGAGNYLNQQANPQQQGLYFNGQPVKWGT